jgi:glycosyltransferase involved in cell wall biosynthesis
MNVAIIIPAHNEERTIAGVIKRAKKYGKIIVVNDASKDRTAAVARRVGAVVINHKANHGLGAALRTGFQYALKTKCDVVITLDADGQHDPNDIKKFLGKINEGYDFVLGNRDLHQYPFIKKFGNFFLNIATNFVSGTSVKDTESGFRAFTKDALKKLYLTSDRYEIAVEIIFEVGKNKLRTANVPIRSPVYVKGVGVIDGFKNFRYLMHRRKRKIRDYIEDFEYVARKQID